MLQEQPLSQALAGDKMGEDFMLSDGYITKMLNVSGRAAPELQALSAKDRIWLAKRNSSMSGSTPVQPV